MMGPSTLVAPFCCHGALVEPLSLFITDSSKVFWKFLQTTEHEVHFDAHFASQIHEILRISSQQNLHNLFFLLPRKFFITSTKDNYVAFLNMHCLNKSLNSMGHTYREQVAYWFNLDKCTLLSGLNTSLACQQLAQFYQVPVAI